MNSPTLTRCWTNWLWFMVLGMSPSVGAAEFRELWNGRDLTGWVLVNTPPATWTVRDSVLICSGKPVGEIRTERMYQNFVLEVEWRHMRPGGNAGIFVWADDITARGVPFHRSIEVQVLENAYGNTHEYTTHGDIFPIHGATMVPVNGRGGDRAFPTEMRSKPSPEWNHYRITCQDGAIALEVNGKLVTQGKNASPRQGYICLESEGGEVQYRNLRIQELPDTPLAPEHVAIADRGYASIYTGLDLSGWNGSELAHKHWHPEDWILEFDGKIAAKEGRISAPADWREGGFLFDVQFNPESQSVQVQLGGDEAFTFHIKPDDPVWSPTLRETGAWNRCEGRVRAGNVSVTMNGKPVIVDQPVRVGQELALEVQGPAKFANLYLLGRCRPR